MKNFHNYLYVNYIKFNFDPDEIHWGRNNSIRNDSVFIGL